jgi:hypothetical protein
MILLHNSVQYRVQNRETQGIVFIMKKEIKIFIMNMKGSTRGKAYAYSNNYNESNVNIILGLYNSIYFL